VILKNPAILILDEATSALDSESERSVQSVLDYLMQGRTTLIIAHRFSTIKNVDRIVVLDSGQIVEVGTHEQLYESGGLYRQLYDTQFKVEAA
jgi:subfamily B ATP-binding cassette protein MsbA